MLTNVLRESGEAARGKYQTPVGHSLPVGGLYRLLVGIDRFRANSHAQINPALVVPLLGLNEKVLDVETGGQELR